MVVGWVIVALHRPLDALESRLGMKRRALAHHLVQDAAQAEDIGTVVDVGRIPSLFGCGVARRPQRSADIGEAHIASPHHLDHAKVQNLGDQPALDPSDDDLPRGERPVHEIGIVSCLYPTQDALEGFEQRIEPRPFFPNPLHKSRPFDQLHDECRRALIDRHVSH